MVFKEKRVISFQSFSFPWKKRILLVLCVYIIWTIKVITLTTDDSVNSESLEKTSLDDPNESINHDVYRDPLEQFSLNSSKIDSINHNERVNLKYCGKKICKFMFPYFIPEQETRANIHLRSITYLARSLDRIMVLPNVGNSRMNCCAPFPFEFYYDLEEMKRMFPDITFMTQQTFKDWAHELSIQPDTLHTWFIEDGRNDSYTVRDHEQMAVEPSETYQKSLLHNLCIDQFNLKIIEYTEFHTGKKDLKNLYRNMARFFTENLKKVESPVILIRNRSRKQMFPLIEKIIPYAPHILKQASDIKKKLQPYYCIHWRMEQGIPEKMPQCARKLIETIDHLKEKEGIDKVYLATDFPISGGKAASQSFYDVNSHHERAMELLKSELNINTWVSLNAFENFRNDEKYASEFNSSGIHGILDKLICIQSDYFLSGPRDCCRISSTYTKLIGRERHALRKKGNGKIRNVVTRWRDLDRNN